jgi:hypothetical protein
MGLYLLHENKNRHSASTRSFWRVPAYADQEISPTSLAIAGSAAAVLEPMLTIEITIA